MVVRLKQLASVHVVAEFIPATPIILGLCVNIRGRRSKPGGDADM